MIKLYSTMVDYLSLTTFNEYAKEWLVRVIEGSVNEAEEDYEMVRKGSYSGWKYKLSGIFVGSTNQKNRETGALANHYMIVASGPIADKLYRMVHHIEGFKDYADVVKCSRIDVQKTFPEWEFRDKTGFNIEDIARIILNARKEDWPDTPPSRAYYEDCTIYLGKRENEVFRRMYLKKSSKDRLYRLETEFKGAKAQQVFRQPSLMEARYLASWSNTPDRINLRWLGDLYQDSCYAEEKSSLEKKREWLSDTVLPAILKDTTDLVIEGRDMKDLTYNCICNILWIYDVLLMEERKTLELEIERLGAKVLS